MVMKVLSNSTQCLVGQPHYLAQLPKGFDPQLLGTLPSVHWGSAQREYQWELFQGEDNSRSIVIPHTPRMVTDDLFALRHFVVAGVGIAHLPRVAVREDWLRGAWWNCCLSGTRDAASCMRSSVAAGVTAVGAGADRSSG